MSEVNTSLKYVYQFGLPNAIGYYKTKLTEQICTLYLIDKTEISKNCINHLLF